MLLKHGGDLASAAKQFGVPIGEWLDLSTGISPFSWPVPAVPNAYWNQLPHQSENLLSAAAKNYNCSRDSVLAVPGSQFAIHFLPRVSFKTGDDCVALPAAGYKEHQLSWETEGFGIKPYASLEELQSLVSNSHLRYAVVINPNNPTTEIVQSKPLLEIASILARRRGFLIVDEAFIDAEAKFSLSRHCPTPGLVVLRSLGKFFGLAGLRLGFFIGPLDLLTKLSAFIPLWTMSSASIWIAEQALEDNAWQSSQKERISHLATSWQKRLTAIFPELSFLQAPLFVTGTGDSDQCRRIYQMLAGLGILVRLFEKEEGLSAIRFGLPNSEMLNDFESRLEEFRAKKSGYEN